MTALSMSIWGLTRLLSAGYSIMQQSSHIRNARVQQHAALAPCSKVH